MGETKITNRKKPRDNDQRHVTISTFSLDLSNLSNQSSYVNLFTNFAALTTIDNLDKKIASENFAHASEGAEAEDRK